MVCRRWRAPPGPHRRRGTQRVPPTFSWKAWQRTSSEGYEAGLPILRRALDVFGIGMSVDEQLRCHWVAGIVAPHLWDDDRWDLLSDRHVQLARGVGALSELPLALSLRAVTLLFAGDLTGAASLIGEHQVAIDATGSHLVPYAELGLAALRGRQAEAAALIDATIREVSRPRRRHRDRRSPSGRTRC